MMKIVLAQPDDLSEIVAIYNQAVALRGATAELKPVTVEDRRKWFEDHTADKFPIWVAKDSGKILGWCSLSAYRPGRMALRYTAEISYYVHEDYRRRSVGTALVEYAINQCKGLEIKTLFALLLDINDASVKLLERFEFVKWGHMPNIADFEGMECGHFIYGLRLIE